MIKKKEQQKDIGKRIGESFQSLLKGQNELTVHEPKIKFKG